MSLRMLLRRSFSTSRGRRLHDAALVSKLRTELSEIKSAGLWKEEHIITSQQDALITINGVEHLNFCANNYLGLANAAPLCAAAKQAIDERGLGAASVRFICGTMDVHKRLERAIADFHGKDDAILYAACFDANGGLFEPLLGPDDALISDELNHASIIDGARLTKTTKLRFKHSDMADLRTQLESVADSPVKLIFTDGVFSMDGNIAQLDKIVELAREFNAVVGVDECHASGVLGKTGRGASEHRGVLPEIDIITSTLGKALGGGMGGFTTSRQEVIDILRQRSRPYLFSNTMAPALVGSAIKVFEMLSASTELRDRLEKNTKFFRQGIAQLGFDVRGDDECSIVPVMLYKDDVNVEFARRIVEKRILVVPFSFPVVPRGLSRIRLQISAAHTEQQLQQVIDAFEEVGKDLKVIQ